jgi:hypothetical protein
MACDIDVPGNKVLVRNDDIASDTVINFWCHVWLGSGALSCVVNGQILSGVVHVRWETHRRLGLRWYPRHRRWACLHRHHKTAGLLRLSLSH